MWVPLLRELGEDRVVVAPDTPGFGSSDVPPAPPTIEDYASVMAGVAVTLGLRQVDCIGYHTGSKTAVQLAIARPDLVRRVVLTSAPVYTDEELAKQKTTMGSPKPLFEDGSHLVRDWHGLYDWRGPGWSIEGVQREFAEQLRAGETSWYGHHAAFRYHHRENLPRVAQPVMVLCPDDDLVTPTRRAKELIRNGQFVELAGWGHGMVEYRTAELAAFLRGFLDAD
jgi:pimeloyl-ACP methyl ester carboxylesterase